MPLPIPTCELCQRPAADLFTVELTGGMPGLKQREPVTITKLCWRCYRVGEYHQENHEPATEGEANGQGPSDQVPSAARDRTRPRR